MSDQTFIEFIIDLTMDHYQKPKAERKKAKEERRSQFTSPYTHKWFGMLPGTVKYLKQSMKRKDKRE